VRISIDSARTLLGQDPVALPGVPIRAIQQRQPGAGQSVVMVDQLLDSSTVIRLLQRRIADASAGLIAAHHALAEAKRRDASAAAALS